MATNPQANSSPAAQSARKTLKAIVKAHPGKLAITGGFVLAENALELLYPIIAGVALDAVLEKDLQTAFIMVGIIFLFWLVGALRRAVDTRIYTKIYQELVGQVILNERKHQVDESAAIVHASLARQFVDFFEFQVPALTTAFVAVGGAVIMLLILEPLIGLLALIVLILSIFSGAHLLKKSEHLAKHLHDRQETEPTVVTKGSPLMIARHFRVVGGRRIQLSDLEAKAYLGLGVMAALLFGALFVHLTSKGTATAGELYTLINYVWSFVLGLDELPFLVQQLSQVSELGKRISTEEQTA